MALTLAHNRMVAGAPVNVLDFGAVGDGVTDDTAAIQAAIDYALTNNLGKIFVPGGNYLVGTINVKTNIEIFGETFSKSSSGVSGTIFKAKSTLNSSYPSVFYNVGTTAETGFSLKNISIDMTSAPATSYAIEVAGAFYPVLDSVFIDNLSNANQIGVYCHVEQIGTYWGRFGGVIVSGTAGTGFKLSNDNPNAGPSTGRTNQIILSQCSAFGLTDGFIFDGCGAGITAINCNAESISQTCVEVLNNSVNGYPTWIGGEINAGVTGFDGKIRIQQCSINGVSGNELTNGAMRERQDAYNSKLEWSCADNEVMSHTLNAGVGADRADYLRCALKVNDIPASTATTIFKIATGAVDFGTGSLSVFLINDDGGQLFNNTRILAHVSWRNASASVTVVDTQNEIGVAGATLSATTSGGYYLVQLTHTETRGSGLINAIVAYDGVATQAAVYP